MKKENILVYIFEFEDGPEAPPKIEIDDPCIIRINFDGMVIGEALNFRRKDGKLYCDAKFMDNSKHLTEEMLNENTLAPTFKVEDGKITRLLNMGLTDWHEDVRLTNNLSPEFEVDLNE